MMRVCWCSAREVVVPRKTPRCGGGACRPKSACAQYTGMNMGRAGMSAVCPFACGGFRNILRTPRHLLGGYMVARSRLLQACEQQTTQQSARAAGNGSLHGGSTVGQPSVQPFIPNASCWNVQDCTQQTKPFQLSQKRRAGNGAPQSVRPLPFAPRDGRHNGRATFAEPGSLALCRSTLHKRVECRQR
jgi:hypothetical protein